MSIHISAAKGEIAETVLLPGDPLRAKWIAEHFLEEAVQYSSVRGMYGYTGKFGGKKISVQGTGMGIPSASIYVHELINDYGAKQLIRIGSAGSYQPFVKVRDIVLAMAASTNSNLNRRIFDHDTYAPAADAELLIKALKIAGKDRIEVRAGNVLTSDTFYDDHPDEYKKWMEYGVLCVEMETAALYTLAARFGVRALAVLTITDHVITGESMEASARETSLRDMIKLALQLA
ncbi:purine-nucleoside phosphorylase [Sinomicrobium soli]|uniref:purine-nucleoside phosphorylase n=1 Tax=Sinomicrobium sp. N-1-3-6 TaxID=2219864 RepID=UPI000DCE025B|nr:purine-nucleoside phosphorylase [Sinomicrobium sp. N-1-3-6]RAV29297.1 purine-nucleoside phosphorylase [Sinomicrobium sp. N-1-3-6]